MAHTRQKDEIRSWNTPGKVFGMFEFDEFIMLALHDRDGHVDIGHIARGIIGLYLHHFADRADERIELVWRSRQFGIVFAVPAETPFDDRTGREFLCAAGIHVAPEEKYACNARGRFHTEDQRDTCTVAPTHHACSLKVQ